MSMPQEYCIEQTWLLHHMLILQEHLIETIRRLAAPDPNPSAGSSVWAGRGRGESRRPHEGQRPKTRVQRTSVSVRIPQSSDPHTRDPMKSNATQTERDSQQTANRQATASRQANGPIDFRNGFKPRTCRVQAWCLGLIRARGSQGKTPH